MGEEIIRERRDATLTLTLNRPKVLNSFNKAMALELQDALAQGAADGAVRVVVLRASGKAFCAGQDLSECDPTNVTPRPALGPILRDLYNPIVFAIRAMPKPVVAAVQGVAAGAGANLAFACDFVLASIEARFIQSFGKVGLLPDSGGTFFLPRLVGLSRAMRLCMLGEELGAEEAFELGLLHDVLPNDSFEEDLAAFCSQIAGLAPKAVAATKKALNASLESTFLEQLALEEKLQGELGETEDYVEGVKAFKERRDPQFSGK